jgi:hypothetical protein
MFKKKGPNESILSTTRYLYYICCHFVPFQICYGTSCHGIMHGPLHARLSAQTRQNVYEHISINMAPIDDAIEALQGPNPPSQAYVASKYGIKPSTLSRRLRGVTTSKAEAYSNKSLLTKQQQLSLVAYINKLYSYRLAPTPAIVRNFAERIAQIRPRKN